MQGRNPSLSVRRDYTEGTVTAVSAVDRLVRELPWHHLAIHHGRDGDKVNTPSLPDPSELLQAALDYHRRGWSIIPTTVNKKRGDWKRAAVAWTRFQTVQPTEAEVRAMFRKRNLTGLAVLLGTASGNLYARDFDNPAAYENWSNAHPLFAKELPTVATGRGYHTYFRTPENLSTVDHGDGELRGIGGYIIAPPSVHHTGTRYRWTIPLPPGQVPEYDMDLLEFDRSWLCTESPKSQKCTEDTEVAEVTNVTKVPDVPDCPGSRCLNEGGLDVESVIRPAIVTEQNTSNTRLFTLAGSVKSEEKRLGRNLTEGELQQVFGAWYEKSLPYLREDQNRDEYEMEFMRALDCRKYDLGAKVLPMTFAAATKTAPPKAALRWIDPSIRLLAAWTRELQRYTNTEPFYLSSHQAAHFLGHKTHTKAYTWLRALASPRIGILKIVQAGTTKRATRFRYLPPLDE